MVVRKKTIELTDLAHRVGAELVRIGTRRSIDSLATLEEATTGQLSFCLHKRYCVQLKNTEATAILTDRALLEDVESLLPEECALLTHNEGTKAFIEVLDLFSCCFPSLSVSPRSQAHIAAGVRLGKNVSYGAVNIAKGCSIGDGTVLADGVCLGEGVTIGKDCMVYPNVVLYPLTSLGDRVIIHSCSVIGADGYGYFSDEKSHHKIPHIGWVVIEDDVEIGANCCIDRATLGVTRIGKGSKLDNLVQIGHNVNIGERVLLCTHTAIGGSTSIGDSTVFAGKAGAIDNITVGKNNRVYMGSYVCNDTQDGATLLGYLARSKQDVLRENVLIQKLPSLLKRLRHLENFVHNKDETKK